MPERAVAGGGIADVDAGGDGHEQRERTREREMEIQRGQQKRRKSYALIHPSERSFTALGSHREK